MRQTQHTGGYLDAADHLLAHVVPGVHGAWPRACAWLMRLALETELAAFWEVCCPEVGQCRSRRAQLLLLPHYCTRELGQRAMHAWVSLSRAGHHHSYELALTAAELRDLRVEVATVITGLAAANRHSC